MSKIAVEQAASLVSIALWAVGCTTHQCDASTITLGLDDGGVGSWDVECSSTNCTLSWESSPLVGTLPDGASVWQPFAGMENLTFVFPPLPSLPANASFPNFLNVSPVPYVSIEPLLIFGDGNLAVAPGSNVEITGLQEATPDGGPDGGPTPGSLTVFNPTCQGFFARVALFGVEATLDAGGEPAAPDAGGEPVVVDGGSEAGAPDATLGTVRLPVDRDHLEP